MSAIMWLILAAAIVVIVIVIRIWDGKKQKDYFRYYIKSRYGKAPKEDKDFAEKLASIRSYWLEVLDAEKPKYYVDDITWNDLDMDLIYQRLNGCQTSIGEEYLYAALRKLSFDGSTLEKREEKICYFAGREEERLVVLNALVSLGKNRYNDLAPFLYQSKEYHTKNYRIYQILGKLPVVFLVIGILLPYFGLPLAFISVCVNAVIHYLESMKMQANMDSMSYMVGMFVCAKNIAGTSAYQDQAVKEQLHAAYRPFSQAMKGMAGAMNHGTTDMEMFYNALKSITLRDLVLYNKFITIVDKYQQEFRNMFELIGELDMSIALGSFRESIPSYCIPELTRAAAKGKSVRSEELTIQTKGLYHPLLEEPVTNDLRLTQNSIITGSNASGKSTFIKALAINSVFAQTIHTCMANSFVSAYFLPITSMAVRDNIVEGDSYFIREIKSLKRILDLLNADVPCLCFVDEILKGTNTVERISASASILDYLSGQNCLSVVASHDIELTKLEEKRYTNYHFQEQIRDEGIFFDYLIKEGASRTRNAIRLLEFMGFDGSVVTAAKDYVKQVENKESIR